MYLLDICTGPLGGDVNEPLNRSAKVASMVIRGNHLDLQLDRLPAVGSSLYTSVKGIWYHLLFVELRQLQWHCG